MSIHRSGLVKPVYIVCIKPVFLPDLTINKGDKLQLVHDIGSMYVVKDAGGKESVVPKDAFKDAPDEK